MLSAEARRGLVFGNRRGRYPGGLIALALISLIVLGGSGVVILSIGGDWPTALSAIALGASAPLILVGFRREPCYLTVNPEGLEDHIAGLGQIRWSQVLDLGLTAFAGSTALVATINDPDGDFARLPTFWRVDGSSNSLIPPKEPIGQVVWPKELLRADPGQALARIQEYRAGAGLGFGTGS